MKAKNILFYTCLLFGGLLNAQEDQTAKATKMGDGPFMSYVINESGGSYTYAGINKEVFTFTFKPYEVNFKEIEIKEAEKTSTQSYYPDEEAFPATYVWGRLNTEACMKGWDYIERREQHRMVILDEWVYILDKWKNKDSYVIEKCFKKGQLSGFGLTKKAFGAAKEMEKANHKETLQKYLDEAFKKQAEQLLIPEMAQKGKVRKEKYKLGKERYQFTIDSVNGNYWNTAEGKRVKAQLDRKAGQAKITLVNDLAVDLLLCHGQGVSTRLKPGEKRQFDCSGDKVRKGKPRANNTSQFDYTDVILIESDGKGCGQTVNASSVYK